jgi:hypothetical protein
MTKKIYNVSIEQPLCRSWEIEAETIDEAIELATQRYNAGEYVLTGDDIGTDAQIMAGAEDGSETTDWSDL